MALKSTSPFAVGETALPKPKSIFADTNDAVKAFSYPYSSNGSFTSVFNSTPHINSTQNNINISHSTPIDPSKLVMKSKPFSEIHDKFSITSDTSLESASTDGKSDVLNSSARSELTGSSRNSLNKVDYGGIENGNMDDEDFSDNEEIECGNCDNDFQTLQEYMDHTCPGNKSIELDTANTADNNTNTNISAECSRDAVRDLTQGIRDTSDVESFDGKIVYNPDGSAYIIEGDSDSEIDSIIDLPRQEGMIIERKGQADIHSHQPIPQIDNAFFVPRNPNSFMNNVFLLPHTQQNTPIMHSYRVYDLRSGKNKSHNSSDANEDHRNSNSPKSNIGSSTSDSSLNLSASLSAASSSRFAASQVTSVPTKPILMCFICKLSFGFSKSFISHATKEHSMDLTTDEEKIMGLKNSSAIIQGIGKDKEPLMSFLEPIKSSSGEVDLKSKHLENSDIENRKTSSMKESTNVSYIHTKPKLSDPFKDKNITMNQNLSKDLSIKEIRDQMKNIDRDSPSAAIINAIALNKTLNYDGKTDKSVFNENKKLKLESDSDSQSSFQMNQIQRYMQEDLMTSTQSQKPFLPSYPTTTRQGIYGVCEEHPNGRAQGVECPSCDMILSSSHSLGGHMTMMHSRNSCKTLKCPKCNWHYKYQETLEIHMKEKHPEGETKCMYCLTNQSHPRLARGESYSCGYKPYRCEVCNYSTTTKGNLSIHMQSDKHLNNVQDIANGGELQMSQHAPHTPHVSQQMDQSHAPPTPTQTSRAPTPSQSSSKTPPHQQLLHQQQREQQHQQQQQHREQQQQLQQQLHAQQQQQQQREQQREQQQQQQSSSSHENMKKTKPKPTWRCDVCNYETNVARNLRIHMTSEKHTHNMMVLQQNMKHMQRDMQLHQMNQLVMLQQDPSFLGLNGPIPGGITFPYDSSLMMGGIPAGFGGESPMDLSKENGIGMGPNDRRDMQDVNRMFQCCVCNIYGTDSLESLHQHLQMDRSKQHESENICVSNGTYMCNLCTYKTTLKANFQLHCKTDKHLQRLQLVNHIKEGGANNEWRLKYLNVSNPVQVRCNACDYYTNSIHKLQIHTGNPRHEASAQLFCHLQKQETKVAATDKYYQCTLCKFNARTKLGLMQHVHSVQHLHSESMKQVEMRELGQVEIDIGDIFTVKEIVNKDSVKFDDEDGVVEEEGNHSNQDPYDDTVTTPLSPSHNNNNNTIKAITTAEELKQKGDGKLSDQLHECPFCTFSSANEMRIKAHVISQHSKKSSRDVACPICQEGFSDKSFIETHLTAVHNVKSEGLEKLLSLVTTVAEETKVTMPPMTVKDGFHSSSRAGDAAYCEIDMDALEVESAQLIMEEAIDLSIAAEKEGEEQFRCQTCSKTFANIDLLYSHQNELGHLELKQTPKGPGYLCWKKGCNQYFKTAQALQMHFREIHAKTLTLSSSDRSEYKYQCQMCTLAFKSQQKLHYHAQLHIIKAAVTCNMCTKTFSSLYAVKKHVESSHNLSDLELDQFNTEQSANIVALSTFMADPRLTKVFNLSNETSEPHNFSYANFKSKMDTEILEENGGVDSELSSKDNSPSSTPISMENGIEKVGNSDGLDKGEDLNSKEQEFFEDYINSQAFAEGSYEDPNRKYKCHRCRVAFTKQNYLTAHNKTIMHRKGDRMTYPMEKFLDPNRPYKCDICKESFTQKNILLVHYNSVSHLHKLKQTGSPSSESPVQLTTPTATSPATSSPSVTTPSSTSTSAPTSSRSTTITDNNSSKRSREVSPEDESMRPYKCNICKVSYSQGSTLDIHIRSVAHQTRASKLNELAMTGEVDLTRPLIEEPTDKSMQQKLSEFLTNQTSMSAMSQSSLLFQGLPGGLTSYPGFPGMPSIPGLPGLPLMNMPPLLPLSIPNQVFQTSTANVTSSQSQSRSASTSSMAQSTSSSTSGLSSSSSISKSVDKISQQLMATQSLKLSESAAQSQNQPSGSIQVCQRCTGVFAGQESYLQHQMFCSGSSASPTPSGSTPTANKSRFVGRVKTAVQRNLLENFGFECVMQFNEFNQRAVRREEEVKEKEKVAAAAADNKSNVESVEQTDDKDKTEKESKHDVDNSVEVKVKEEKMEMDLPEMKMNKCVCGQCSKKFSSIWVLKAHQEEVHKEIVPVGIIEDIGDQFKEDFEKKLPKEPVLPEFQSIPVTVSIPSSTSVEEKVIKQEMPPPPPPLPAQLSMDMLNMMNMMSMGMMPMPMSMPLMFGGQPSFMPMMMPPPGMESGMKSPSVSPMDPTSSMTVQQTQQMQNAAMANQKRARTRINDEQLKVLRGYFDINNSPSEEQVQAMSDTTGLPMKVIKHWFRNTLFKERQRNKDSPYNFNNPTTTTLDLEEYEKTGKTTVIEDNSPHSSNNPSPALKTPIFEPEIKKEPVEHIEEMPRENPFIGRTEDKTNNNSHKHKPSSQELHSYPTPKQSPNPGHHNSSLPLPASSSSATSAHNTSASVSMSSSSSSSSAVGLSSSSVKLTPPPGSHDSLMQSFASSLAGLGTSGVTNFPPTSTTPNSTPLYEHHSYSPPGGSSGRRANRTRFTDYQIKSLQEYFEQNAYPKDDELEHLSKMLGLSPRVIVVWFQNARQKARKIYENQPADNVKDISTTSSTGSSPFNRTPGLNYQCQKCQAVFQRYYDLIRHQKRQCFSEGEKQEMHMMSDDSDSLSHVTSLDNTYFSDSESETETSSMIGNNQPSFSLNKPAITKDNSSSAAANNDAFSSSSSSNNKLQCDKCDMSFHNADLFREHQNVHNMNPSLFMGLPPSSAFSVLHSMATQQQLPMNDLSPGKRKYEEEYDDPDQPRDKRLRTTILPEQLDYLYQKYQLDCNPSRKQLEAISKDVGLKKRVVQVWFQNTRARERKGQFRAHQQLIHKRCPICRALFRAKSALEAHLATKHPDEMAKGEICVDNIPDAAIESPGLSSDSFLAPSPDYNKLLAPPAMQGLLPYMPQSSMGFPPMADPIQLSMKQFYEDSFKKYINELSSTSHSGPKESTSRSHMSHEMTSTPMKSESSISSSMDNDAPLDLSKPLKVSTHSEQEKHRDGPMSYSSHSSSGGLSGSGHSERRGHNSGQSGSQALSASLDVLDSSVDQSYMMKRFNHDSSLQLELDMTEDESYMSSNPTSPGLHQLSMGNKRYRTQMTSLQVRIMKQIFIDYKTPTMAECEMLGRIIGLPKRVIQVWFQNARAKEKKAKLNMSKSYSQSEMDFPKPPEECTLCCFKYSHKYTIQDHIFTKKHIDKVKEFIQTQTDVEREISSSAASIAGVSGLMRSQQANDVNHMRQLMEEANAQSQIAQLQSMGLAPLGIPPGAMAGMNLLNPEFFHDMKKDGVSSKDKVKKEGHSKLEGSSKKDTKGQLSSAEGAHLQGLNMLSSPFGGMLPGMDPAMLPFMYPGLPGMIPGVGVPGLPPLQPGGYMPGTEHLLGYDPMTYGTPLQLLQIPQQAIKDVSSKLMEPMATIGQYTQDCKSISSLRSLVNSTDYNCAREATVDVGFICKKCQMVYPAKDACTGHQRMMCFPGGKIPNGINPTLKLEQIQYECKVCTEKMSTVQEFKSHCQTEGHKVKVAQYQQQKSSASSSQKSSMLLSTTPRASGNVGDKDRSQNRENDIDTDMHDNVA